MSVVDDNTSTLKSASVLTTEKVTTKNYVFTLLAEVISPKVNDSTVQATDVEISDNGFAFVSYNTRGNTYRGGIDVFNVSDVKNPRIISEILFPDADVSAVAYSKNKLYAVGATSNDSLKFNSPAFLEVFSLDASSKIQKVDTIIELNSQVGTDVKVDGDYLYITTGAVNGGLNIYDMTNKYKYVKTEYSVNATFDLENARAVNINGDNIYVLLSAQSVGDNKGRIVKITKTGTSFSFDKIVGIMGLATPDSKSTIYSDDKYLYASLNEGGMSVINISDLSTVRQNIARPLIPAGALAGDYVTNAVTVNTDLVFTANGGAGISINNIIPTHADSLFSIGKFQFKDNSSSNYVKSKGDVVFVACGLGGLKILGITVDDGVPPFVIPTKPCPTLYKNIISAFPEAVNNMGKYPTLFADGTTKTILTKEATDVYVTFVWEGAGYKNTLGYYSYPAGTTPNIADLQKHVIFPNASQDGSGGALKTGDMVKINTAKFPANTVIGFYLVADGWRNGLETQGYYTWYSDLSLNNNDGQHQLLFIEKNCDDLVLTFEDVKLSSSDKDFNDVMFTVSDDADVTTANTKFDLTGIVKL